MVINYKDIDSDIVDLTLGNELVFDDPSGKVTVSSFTGQLIKMDGGWHLRGSFSARLDGECHRCGTDASVNFNADVSVNIVPGEPQFSGTEYEMQDEEGDIFYSALDHLDLGELIREEAILQLPLRCLCSEDCKGSDLIDKDGAAGNNTATPLSQLSVLKKAPEEK